MSIARSSVPQAVALRERILFWVIRVVVVGVGAASAYGIALGVWRLPAATVPALLAAVVGYLRAPVIDGKSEHDLDAAFDRVVVWGIGGGAVGYCLLATFSIGLLADGIGLGWRIFGGAVVGASVGVFVALGVNMIHMSVTLALLVLRGQRAA